jgi:hypothetical protein
MIEVTVAYPAGQGRTFDMDYYSHLSPSPRRSRKSCMRLRS